MKQCFNCNAPMEDDATVCAACGATYKKPLTKKESSNRAFAWAIATLVFAMSSPVVGIILWLISKGKIAEHDRLYGDSDPLARVATIMHKVAFLLSIISLIVTAASLLLVALTYGVIIVVYIVLAMLAGLMML